MERHHTVSSGHAQEDDSWTCQHCGWVYPNAHPSAKHRRKHKKQCGKISQLHKGGSSDEASSGDDSHLHKATEASSAAPDADHSDVAQSRDLLVNELNVADNKKLHTPQDIPASLDAKPVGSQNVTSQETTSTDVVKIDPSAPEYEPEQSNVLLNKTPNTSEQGQMSYAIPADRVDEPVHISAGSYTDGPKDNVKDVKQHEDPPLDPTFNETVGSVREDHEPHARGIDTVEAAVHDSARLDFNQASSAGAKYEGIPPKHTESVASLDAPSNTSQDEMKGSITPSMNTGEIAALESQGLHADQVKRNGSLSKGMTLHRQGSSQGDDSWTCRHCGWVYPNAHPSAKHRKKHKKQCGKVKGFELPTKPHNVGSSDEVSSDEDLHARKEDIPHPPLQLLQPQEQANETVAGETLSSNVDQSATFAEGEGITGSAANSLQHRKSSAQGDALHRELGETQNVREISTPDTVPSVVPEFPQNVPFSDQENLPAVPSSPKSVDTSASESHGEPGKGYNHEHESRTKFIEEPAEPLAEFAPEATSISSVSDLKSSDAPPVHFEDNGASVAEVDKPNAVLSALDLRGAGLSNETSSASSGEGHKEGVILNEERGKPEQKGLDKTNDPLRTDTGPAVTGALTGQLESEVVSSDLPLHTLPVDQAPTENKSVTENSQPITTLSAANGAGLAKDEGEEGRFLNAQSDANPAQLVPKDELSAPIVGGCSDSAAFWSKDKTDETPPVAKTKDLMVNQTASSSTDKTNETAPVTEAVFDNRMASVEDVPKEVNIPALTSGEAVSIQRGLDEFTSADNLPGAEGSREGETGGNLQYKKIGEESGVVDTANESQAAGIAKDISSGKAGVPEKTEESGAREALVKPETKEETPPKTEGIGSSDETARPKPKDETPFETNGIASSELSFHDTYSFPRSESLVTAPSELSLVSAPSDVETLFHKNSDSLEIFEDAPDSLDTCSVGGSVDENEGWDEQRQGSGRLREEREHLGAVSLEEKVPSEHPTAIMQPKDQGAATLDESKSSENAATDEPIQGEHVVVKQDSSATNGSSSGETSSEERASTLPGTRHEVRNKSEDLKAPSPEAWQEPGPSNAKSDGKKVSTSEVTEETKPSEGSSTALRNLMAKEGQDKAEPTVETSTKAGNVESLNRKEGSVASPKGPKPKSRSFWRYCVCCSPVN